MNTSTTADFVERDVATPTLPANASARTLCPPKRAQKGFRALYCERYECAAARFEAELFWQSIYRHAYPLAWFLRAVVPDFFREDFSFIRDLSSAVSRGEVHMELNRFYGRNVRDHSFLRRYVLVRVSGKRIRRIARELFR